MEPFGIGMAGLGVAGLSTFGAFGLAFRQRRRRLAAASSRAAVVAGTRGAPRSTAERLEALAAAQAELGQRLEAIAAQAAAPEERLQAMAGQLLGLIRDKNATLETALAGLDQLRARMRAIEQMGEPAEARALLDRLGERLGALETAQATAVAVTEARLAALDGSSGTAADFARTVADLGERLARLQEARDAGLEATLARIAPLEARLGLLDGGRVEGREVLKRLESRLEALSGEATAVRSEFRAELRAELAALKAEAQARMEAAAAPLAHEIARLGPVEGRLAAFEARLAELDPQGALDRFAERLEGVAARVSLIEGAENPVAEITERLAELHAQKDIAVEVLTQRLAPLEARLAELDPQGALDRFAERLEGVAARVSLIEGAENSVAEITERLAELHAQKDIAVEVLTQRLAPLEARLAELDPQGALDRFAERLEGVAARVSLIEGAENPVAEITERLAELHAQKDIAVEVLTQRLAPLEARLAELDPQGALDRFAERLEGVAARVSLIEGAENPVAEITERLAELHAQKDIAVEVLTQRLAPLEAKLAELDPQGALDRFAERLEGVAARVSLIEGAENPVAEITERLAELHAQKDIAVEVLTQRLAPLEAKLAELDPQGALDRFAERLEGVAARVSLIEGAENPVAEITERLAELHAQKDIAVEVLTQRLAPLEAKLAELEGGVARVLPLAEENLLAALAALKARLEALDHAQEAVAVGIEALRAGLARDAEAEAGAEGLAAGQVAGTAAALAEVVDGMTRLFAQKDASLAAFLARLAPLEERLAAVEARPRDPAVAEAEDEAAGERLALVQPAAKASAERTVLFADRISELEASLPRLAAAETRAIAEQASGQEAGTSAPGSVPVLEALRDLPRVASLHRSETGRRR